MDKKEVLKRCKEEQVRFMRLQFTDILGQVKNVEVPQSQFDKALDGQVLFDGSSIQGFARIEESDMLLKPDPASFQVFPFDEGDRGRVGRLICDVYNPDDTPFDGCPRIALKRVLEEAESMGYTMVAGPEAEFFLFEKNEQGEPTTVTHDSGGYFDLAPIDRGEDCRRVIVNILDKMGFEVEAAHHEVAHGQHEIDFKYADAITTADRVSTFRFIVRKVAQDFNLHATFMPKPIFGQNGSGMHVHMSLFKGDEPAFFDPNGEYDGLSKPCLSYIAGLLDHAEAICAITNPIVNSYKRLVPGYEAPTNIAWSEKNRSPMVRVPARRGVGSRCELRMPDPSCNPYLALAVMLKAGLDGIKRDLTPPDPVQKNIFSMTDEERRQHKIRHLPENLKQACEALGRDEVIREALGTHIFEHFIDAKMQMWHEYVAQVHSWELDQYLTAY